MMPLATRGPSSNGTQNGCTPSELHICSDPSEAQRVQQEIEQALKERDYTDKEIFSIKLALEEALVNAIKHGNQLDRGKRVSVSYHVHVDRFECIVADEGPGFDPNEVPDPTAPENLERCCGRGLMLMRHYMCEVSHNDRGNAVHMRKHRAK